ncbi:hypothetical protein HNQ99_000454 [Rhizorhapis suberifaciens]|uniref:Uncharacterized protein n=1 Tax=Rhizorhapis suberifaciens TaxID=13656 RepID=A0A840HRI5_9SPHN|nr:hypothetical protein [Rhizorhapis suberifaciens]
MALSRFHYPRSRCWQASAIKVTGAFIGHELADHSFPYRLALASRLLTEAPVGYNAKTALDLLLEGR